jgi:SAM-dependent methyltransferase
MDETSKALIRRLHDVRYVNTYFKGEGIDIGAGRDSIGKYKEQFPLMANVKAWDMPDGDAQYMASVPDNTYDFVHSSHCLEHMVDPNIAFKNWVRICKPGGYIITCIPDEDLYEQGVFPSTFNGDHKSTWSISKEKSWSPVHVSLTTFLRQFNEDIEVLKVELINGSYMYNSVRIDQTSSSISECAIEFIARKKTQTEKDKFGRYPPQIKQFSLNDLLR